MARRAGGVAPSPKKSSQSVSPAVAALVIVVVLLAVFALVWKFTTGPARTGGAGGRRGGLFGGRGLKMPTTVTPDTQAKAKIVQEKLLKAMGGQKSSTETVPPP